MKVNKRSAAICGWEKKGRQLALSELGISMRRRGAKISIKSPEHDTCPRSQIFLRPIRLSPFHLWWGAEQDLARRPTRTQPNPLIKIVHIGTSGMCNIQRSSSFISTATQTEDWEIMWNSDFIRLNCTVFRHTHTHTSRDLFTHRRRDCTHAEWQSLEG